MLSALILIAACQATAPPPPAVPKALGGSMEKAREYINEPKGETAIAQARSRLKAAGLKPDVQHRVFSRIAPAWARVYGWAEGDDVEYLAALGEAMDALRGAEVEFKLTADQARWIRLDRAKDIARRKPAAPPAAVAAADAEDSPGPASSAELGMMPPTPAPKPTVVDKVRKRNLKKAKELDALYAAANQGGQVATSVTNYAQVTGAAEARQRNANFWGNLPPTAQTYSGVRGAASLPTPIYYNGYSPYVTLMGNVPIYRYPNGSYHLYGGTPAHRRPDGQWVARGADGRWYNVETGAVVSGP